MQVPEKYQKLVSVLIFVVSIAISFSIWLIPINTQQLALFGYGGVFIVTLLGGMTLFIPGPTMVATFLAGRALNPLMVSIVAGFGSALGEFTGYSAGYASRGFVSTEINQSRWYYRLFHWITAYPFLTIFILAAIPNFLTDMSGIIAGRIEYPFPKFLLATFIGKSIRFGAAAYIGAWFFSTH
jgi:membrane protein YqaA with SNARE-associated domain